MKTICVAFTSAVHALSAVVLPSRTFGASIVIVYVTVKADHVSNCNYIAVLTIIISVYFYVSVRLLFPLSRPSAVF